MLDFLSMASNREQCKVDNYEGEDGLVIDTCAVSDSEKPYETGVCHPAYNGGDWIIVELYDTKKEAQIGHMKWEKLMTADTLPENLTDVSSAKIAQLLDIFSIDDSWRKKKLWV